MSPALPTVTARQLTRALERAGTLGRYHPLAANQDGSLFSETTGLILRVEGHKLRLIDAATGERILWNKEYEPLLRGIEPRVTPETEA